MGLHVGNLPVKQVYVGSTPVTAVYVGAQKVWPTSEVHEVTLTDVTGTNRFHPLLTVAVPAGETWTVTVQGTISTLIDRTTRQPQIVIGSTTSGYYGDGAVVSMTGTVTSESPDIGVRTNGGSALPEWGVSFTGTVTIEK